MFLIFAGRWQNAEAQTATFAQPPEPPQQRASRSPLAQAPDRPTRWYGYQPAATDVAAVGLMFGALVTWHDCISHVAWFDEGAQQPSSNDQHPTCNNGTSNAFAEASVAGYLLGAPVIHAAHGHWDKAGLSLGLRATPLLLGLGLTAAQHRGSSNLAAWTIIGGAFAAMIGDDVLLAHEPVPEASSAWYVAPAVDARGRSASVLVGGAF